MSGRDDLKDEEQRYRQSRNGNGPDPNPGLVATGAGSVKPKTVQWLWKGWIPLGMLTLLVGLPGRGKTTLAEELAAQLTRGDLPGELHGSPSDVLLISYEDSVEHTIVPRLIAAEADLNRVTLLSCRDVGKSIDLTGSLDEIEQLIKQHGAKLLVVDPLVAGMPAGGVNSHRDQDVRSVLAPLAALAERNRMAIVSTMHFSKSATSALIGAGGSIGFVGAARSILVFGLDPNDERGAQGPKRILAHAKSNVGKLQNSVELSLTEAVLDPFGGEPIFTSRIEIGAKSDVTADDLVQDRNQSTPPRVQAERFLRELLADGPHKAAEVFDLAEGADIAVRTLKRAKGDLDIESSRKDGKWWWKLPDEGPKDEDDEHPELPF